MSTVIISLGHGGGVPLGLGEGNTNFAVVPDVDRNGIEWSQAVDPHVCQLFLQKHKFWLVDCGPETVVKLCEWDVVKNLLGVFITHCHADHSGGLSMLAWRCRFIDKIKPHLRFNIALNSFIAHQTVELCYANARQVADNGGMNWTLNDFFEVPTPYDEEEQLGVKYDFIRANHGIPSFPAFSLRLDFDNKGVLFSGDIVHPFASEQRLVDILLKNTELIFHDVQFYNPGDGYEVHCPYGKLRDAIPPKHRHKVVLAHTVKAPPQEAFDDGFKWAKRYSMFIVD